MSKRGPRPIVVKTTVNLPQDVHHLALDTAAACNASFSDIVRDALNLHRRLYNATRIGEKVLLESQEKGVRELLIPTISTNE